MIIRVLNDITKISDDEEINTENFLDSLNYVDTIYNLISMIQNDVNLKLVKFLPSFKGMFVVEKLGVGSVASENELKLFRIQSEQFVSDKQLYEKLKTKLKNDTKQFFLVDSILTIEVY